MWVYEIRSGKFYEDSGGLIAIGYSGGNKGENPGAVNNASLISVPFVGPIPPGIYDINAPRDDPHTGKYTLDLVADPDNQMYGREGFRIHGDNPRLNKSASEGCIILPRSIREQIWMSGDHTLRVLIAEEKLV